MADPLDQFDITGGTPGETAPPAAPPQPVVGPDTGAPSPADLSETPMPGASEQSPSDFGQWARNVVHDANRPAPPHSAQPAEQEPWEATGPTDEDEPWNAYQQPGQSGDIDPYSVLETPPFPYAPGKFPDIDRLDSYAGVQTINNIVNSFPAAAHGATQGYKNSAAIPESFYSLSPQVKETLKTWSEYSDVEKKQAGLLQAFNAAAVFPAVRSLAEAAITLSTWPVKAVETGLIQIPMAGVGALQTGLAEFGERQWPSTGAGRELAGLVEMGAAEGLGRAGAHARLAPEVSPLRVLKTETGVEPVIQLADEPHLVGETAFGGLRFGAREDFQPDPAAPGTGWLKTPTGSVERVTILPGEGVMPVQDADGRVRFVPPGDLLPPVMPRDLDLAARSGLTGTGKTELSPEDVEAETAPIVDNIHTQVRGTNPALFDAYDPLMAERDRLRANLTERDTDLRQRAEMNAAEGASESDIDADHERRMGEDSQIANWTDQLRNVETKLAELEPEVRDAYKREAKAAQFDPTKAPELALDSDKIGSLDRAFDASDGAPVVWTGLTDAERAEFQSLGIIDADGKVSYTVVRQLEAERSRRVRGEAEAPVGQLPPSSTDIVDHVSGQLQRAWQASGREGTPEQFAEEARAGGSLVEAFFQTISDQFGGRRGTASQIYDKIGPDILGVKVLGEGGTASGATDLAKNFKHLIKLAKRSDASTFVHELAHVMESLITKLAEDPTAPEAIRNDVATLQQWKNRPQRGIAKDERVARGFEKYLSEGRAPSAELANVFSQFADWLKRVYAKFSNTIGINDDIRNVFDRWLAKVPDAREATIVPEPTVPPRASRGRAAQPGGRAAPIQGAPPESKPLPTTMEELGPEPIVRPINTLRDPETGRVQIGIKDAENVGDAAAQRIWYAEMAAKADWQANRQRILAANQPEGSLAPEDVRRLAREMLTPTAEPEAAPVEVVTATPPEPEPLVAKNFGPEAKEPPPKPPRPTSVYMRVPREPKRLTQFVNEGVVVGRGTAAEHIEMRGLMPEPNGLRQLQAVLNGKPKVINPRDGEPLDHARERAVEAGYFPQGGEDINGLYDALTEDNSGTPRYSMYDDDAVVAYERAVKHNREIDRLSAEHDIDPRGMTLQAFIKAIEDKVGKDEFDAKALMERARAIDEANEMRDDLVHWEGNEAQHAEGLDELEFEGLWREASTSQELVGGDAGHGEPGVSGGSEGEGTEGQGSERGGTGDAGPPAEPVRTEPEPGTGRGVEPAVERIPRRPKTLIEWLRDTGGINEDHAEIAKADLYEDEGRDLNQAAIEAQRAGYFSDLGAHPADATELIDAIRQENDGTPVFASSDAAAVKAFNDAVLHNRWISDIGTKYGIDPAGKTLDAFLGELREKVGDEAYARLAEEQHADAISKGEETKENAANVAPAAAAEVAAASEPDLEALWQSATAEGAARQLDVGPEDGGGRDPTAGDAGPGAAGVGGERGGLGDAGSTGTATGGRGPLPESHPVGTLADSIKPEARADIEKVGNIRWDYFDNDLFALARDTMAKLGWFPDNRGPTEGVFRARATSVLMNAAWEQLQAAKTAFLNSPNGDTGIAMIKAQQNAAKATLVQSEMLADWGKTGNALRDILKNTRARVSEIQRLGDLSQKTLFQIQEQMRLADTYTSIDQYNRFMMDVNTTRYQKARNGILSFYINNLLSNPITHTGYLLGNEMINLYKSTAEAAVQAGVGSLRQTVQSALGREVSDADRAHIGEVRAALAGSWTGTQVGVRAAWSAWKTGEMLMQGLSDQPVPRQQAIFGMIGIDPNNANALQIGANRVGYILETPTRTIQAIHVFSYARAYGAELGRLAYHDAIGRVGEGAAPEEVGAAMQRFYNAVPDEARAAAHDEAIRTVLMRRPGQETAVGRALNSVNAAVNRNALLKMLFPFNQIGFNLATEGVGRRSLLALAMPDVRADLSGANGGRAFDLAAGRILAGSALATGAVTMAAMGLITGPGPSRETQAGRNFAAVQQDQGVANDAFKIGNVYVPYLKVLGPLGQLMSLAASFKDTVAYMTDDEAMEAAHNLAHGFGHAVIDDTAFRTLHDFHEAVIGSRAGQGSGIVPYLDNVASNFLPFSSAMNGLARQIDPYIRRSDNLIEAVQKKVPGLSMSLPEAVGPWGIGSIAHTTMGIHILRDDPVNQAFIRMGMGPSPLPHKINGMAMDTREYEKYGQLSGTVAHQMLLPLVTQPGFEQIPPGEKMEIMSGLIGAGRASGQAQVTAMNPKKFILDAQDLQMKMLMEGKAPGGTPAMRQ